jgi:asparagine synthase (glutamine-hydrolysing)
MPDFLICIPRHKDLKDLVSVRELSRSGELPADQAIIYFGTAKDIIVIKSSGQEDFYFWGDFIIPEKIEKNRFFQDLADNFNQQQLKYINGLFYVIQYSARTSTLRIYNSVFSILPVYYHATDRHVLISSSIALLRRQPEARFTLNKRFLLEQILFAYPLFSSTVFSEIQIIPANSYLEYAGQKLQGHKHTFIEQSYHRELIPLKKAQQEISALFIDLVRDYFPADGCYISFTSGFDGRTLVACAKNAGKKFKTFSFGTRDNPDITFPAVDAIELDLEHFPVILDEPAYIRERYLPDGAELIGQSALNSNYLYVQFLYAAKILSADTRCLVTGYGGSELFRALHVAGAMTPPELVKCLTADDDSWIGFIKKSVKLKSLRLSEFNVVLDDLVETIKQYRNSQPAELTLNQKFYRYIFEEVFRKFFGSLIAPQLRYLNIRLPFLNFRLLEELLKTELAGVNNPFFTHNPLQRYKGQLLYAEIIRNTAPEMLRQLTGKGYRPGDLLNLRGRLRIVYPFLKKRLRRKIRKTDLDNLGIISALKFHKKYFSGLIDRSDFHDRSYLQALLNDVDLRQPEQLRDNLAISLSQLSYLESINH